MICSACDHEIPTPPPLRDDYDGLLTYQDALAVWYRDRAGKTPEWGYCRCVRCVTCWALCPAADNRKVQRCPACLATVVQLPPDPRDALDRSPLP
jgi:succinate dehydrogenase/fumarate reductase-like Fe-S protein